MSYIIGEKTAAEHYDEIPYLSTVKAKTHPDHLAAVGTFFGIDVPAVESCRVLELACNNGINLVAITRSLPESTCVGLDLSGEAIAEGRAIARGLGLQNISLHRGDILDIPGELGEFDYIIVSGVYTWVAPETQQGILDVCRRHLSRNGLACIQYAAYPGQLHSRLMFRDLILRHTRDIEDPQRFIARAREVIQALTETVPPGNSANSAFLRQVLNNFAQTPDSDLYHELLAPDITPVDFQQFVQQAAEHNLRYVADADLDTPQPGPFPELTPKGLRQLDVDLVGRERACDFLGIRANRSSLLCHEEVAVERSPAPERMRAFRVASPLTPATPTPDMQAGTRLRFETPGGGAAATAQPLQKAALLRLSEQWPASMPFERLVDEARARLGQSAGARDSDLHDLGKGLMQYFERGFVKLYVRGPQVACEAGERPRAGELARFLAAHPGRFPRIRSLRPEGVTVFNQLHNAVALDRASAQLLTHLDGGHDRNALRGVLVRLLGPDAPADEQALDQYLAQALQRFAQEGLLVE